MIRQMKVEDIEVVLKLINEEPELMDFDDGEDYMSAEILAGLISSPEDLLVVYEMDGEIVGVVLALFSRYSKVGYIQDIVVAESARGKGVGSQILDYVFDDFKSRGAIETWCLVHEGNLRMQKIMGKKGFRKGRKFYLMSR